MPSRNAPTASQPLPVPPRIGAACIALCAAQSAQSAPTVPTEIQLLPAGEFRAWDGRPTDVPAWRIDAAAAQALIAQLAQRANPLAIDYEHQTLHARQNGQPAPAAGWFDALEWREGSGLWATGVRWSERAAAMIAAGEYRYISPVFAYDPHTGSVTRILHAALVNDPALDGMAAVAAASAMAAGHIPTSTYSITNPTESAAMDDIIESLVYLLNLPITSTPQEISAQLDKLKAQLLASDPQAAASFAGLGAHIAALTERATQAASQVAALKATHQPSEVVAELQSKLAALQADHLERTVQDLVAPALADGRLLPVQEDWARELGKTNLAALKSYLATAQPIAALTGVQSGQRTSTPPTAALTAEQELLCRVGGWDKAVFVAATTNATTATA